MTFFRKLITSKPWLASIAIPLSFFLILFLASGFVGLSDDEAYYWVLAQKPALGYAYHPPGVAWMIWLSQFLLGRIFGPSSPAVVRFFSCFSMSIMVWLALDWMKSAGSLRRNASALVLASFAGMFGLGWMMIPDTPLYLGWMISFYCAWKIANEARVSFFSYLFLGIGVAFSILGKYSGILVPFSCILAVFSGPYGRARIFKALAAVVLGTLLGLVPIVIWNSQHQWQSILYQIEERHQGSEISWKRYLRFWLIEILAAGPVLLVYSLALMKRAFSKNLGLDSRSVFRFVALFMIPPALIYCVQPLFSDFKPHWAFIVWFPGVLAFAWEAGRGSARFAKTQIMYGLSLILIVLVSLHVPLMGKIIHHYRGKHYDPRWDVSNDLYGWSQLRDFSEAHSVAGKQPDFLASRYQTASHAAAALGSLEHVSMVPRDLKARDEWPVLDVTTGIGPEWPELTAPVYFVGDNRYDAPPEFRSSRCESLAPLDSFRGELLAKRILIWRCVPISWPN